MDVFPEYSLLQNSLEQLRLLFPVAGLVHVGAGDGYRVFPYANWGVKTALLIEADESQFGTLTAVVKDKHGWSVCNTLVGAEDCNREFYIASNPNESGVIPCEDLRVLWRNLYTCDKRTLAATTIESLWQSESILREKFDSPNWLFIDCLPALPILTGAGKMLEDIEIVVVRALIDDKILRNSGASRKEVGEFMSDRGYRCVAMVQELHPAIAIVVYARNWKSLLSPRVMELRDRNQELAQSLRAQEDLLVDRQTRIDAGEKTLCEMQGHLRESQSQVVLLQVELDHQTTKTTETICQYQSRITENDDRTELLLAKIAESQKELLSVRREGLKQGQENAEQCETIRRLTESLDNQAGLLVDRQALIDNSNMRLIELQNGVVECHKQIEELELKLQHQMTVSAKVEEFQTQLRSLHQELAKREEAVVGLNKKVGQLTENLSSQLSLQIDRQKRIDELGQELQQQDAVAAQTSDELRRQIIVSDDRICLLSKEVESSQEELAILRQETAAKESQIIEQRRQTEFWNQSLEKLQALSDGYVQQIGVLEREVAEKHKSLSESLEMLEKLSKDHDEQNHRSLESMAQIKELTRSSEMQSARLVQLENERSEMDGRQRLLDQEIVKAEAQIELIKDVVLREKAF